MKSECLPFSQIPHTTRIFSDFLSDYSKVQQFYPRSAYFDQWFKDEALNLVMTLNGDSVFPAVLERQKSMVGRIRKTVENMSTSSRRFGNRYRPASRTLRRPVVFHF